MVIGTGLKGNGMEICDKTAVIAVNIATVHISLIEK
jgi:hypothetical protein